MKLRIYLLLMLLSSGALMGASQTKLGEGNALALKIGPSSPLVQAAMRAILKM